MDLAHDIPEHARFIVTPDGQKTEVILPLKDYEYLMSLVEELEDIRDFDERIKSDEWVDLAELEKKFDV